MVEKIRKSLHESSGARWTAMLLVAFTMFAAYFFSDVFSPVKDALTASRLQWNNTEYGQFAGSYSLLCVFGGLIICGMLLDIWGVRITGTVFAALMVVGAGVCWYGTSEYFNNGGFGYEFFNSFWHTYKPSVKVGVIGFSIFGLGAEIAGVAVTKTLAKWFKGKEMATAMSLQVSIARLGSSSAFFIIPLIVGLQAEGYPHIAAPIKVGLFLLAVGLLTYLIFCVMDKKFDHEESMATGGASDEDKFKFSDVIKILTNKHFLLIAFLCVFFYSCVFPFQKYATSILSNKFLLEPAAASRMIGLLPLGAIIFTPIFGSIVDTKGRSTRLMILGSFIVLIVHLIFAFAPAQEMFGYFAVIVLGVGFSLVPAAMWPAVPKIIPISKLGTAYSLIYWIQNIGLWGVPILAGIITDATNPGIADQIKQGIDAKYNYYYVELMFVAIGVIAILTAFILSKSDPNHKIGLDLPNKQKKQ